MEWFLVVYFLSKGNWIEAEDLGKEGWSPIIQEDYYECIEKSNDANQRFQKIAEYREIELDILFTCECRINEENKNSINCKDRNWFQKIYDKIFLIK